MNYCYVILHYKNETDTRKCVDSLLEKASKDSRFIVVDNGSNDGSGQDLEKLYKDEPQCEVLILEENVGFSKGNNAGYKLAREKYNPDFIIVTNNDVVFWQDDFEQNIAQIYERTGFFVLGPDIYVPRHNDHQSPLFKNGITADELERELSEYRFYRDNPKKFNRRLAIHAFKNMLCSNVSLIRYVYTALRGKDNMDYKKEYEDVGLQGACLIFSKNFIQKEEKAFDPEPFLYEEEVFLFYRCKEKNYKMVYSPDIAIRHEEAASFTNANKNNMDRLNFMLNHHVIAREMLLEYLTKEYKK